jgi:hypothetical protein
MAFVVSPNWILAVDIDAIGIDDLPSDTLAKINDLGLRAVAEDLRYCQIYKLAV